MSTYSDIQKFVNKHPHYTNCQETATLKNITTNGDIQKLKNSEKSELEPFSFYGNFGMPNGAEAQHSIQWQFHLRL